MTQLRAAIYCRVSTSEQTEGYSLSAQERACRAYCEEHGWPDPSLFVDEGKSAHSDAIAKRPAFRALLAAVEQRAVDVVVVHKFDRLSRSMTLTVETLRRFSDANCGFVSITEAFDYATPQGRLSLHILAALADFYSQNLSKETSKGKQERRAQGLYNGILPFGYKRESAERAVAMVDDVAAAGVRLAFQMAAGGRAATEIADALNRAGHRTHGPHGVNPWTRDSVRYVLANRFYLGELPGGLPGQHPPIVTPDEYDAARAGMAARTHRAVHVKRAANRYSVTGLLVCGRCGAPMNVTSWRNTARVYCGRRRQHNDCDQPSVSISVVEAQLEDWLYGLRASESDVGRVLMEAEKVAALPDDTERERRKLTGRMERLKRLYLLGDISEAEYRAERDGLVAEIADLPKPVESERQDVEASARIVRDAQSTWQTLSQADRNAMLLLLVERIVIDDERVEVEPRPAIARLAPDCCKNRRRRDSATYLTALTARMCPERLAGIAVSAGEGSIRSSAALHGVSRQTVRRALERAGIETRGYQAILTAEQAAEIRAAPRGYGTGRALSRQYGVSPSTITAIRKGRQWVR